MSVKKCPECRAYNSANDNYCVICGTALAVSVNAIRERRFFVLTPIFIVLLVFSLFYELKTPNTNAIMVAGFFASVFLLSGSFFYLIAKLSGLQTEPTAPWRAGLLAFLQLIASILISYYAIIFFYTAIPREASPLEPENTRFILLLSFFLPTYFSGIVFIAAEKRFAHLLTGITQWILKNIVLIISSLSFLFVAIIFLSLTQNEKCLVHIRILRELGAKEKAIKQIDDLISNEPTYAPLIFEKLLLLSDNHSNNEKTLQKMDELYRKLLQLEPEVPIYLFNAGTFYDSFNQPNRALALTQKAARILHDDYYLWAHLGNMYLSNNESDKALVAYKNAIVLAPDNPFILNNLAYCMLENNIEPQQALVLARESVKLLPDQASTIDTLAWAYYKNKMYSQALTTIEPLITSENNINPEIEFHYLMILKKLDLLKNQYNAFDRLLTNPELIKNKPLFEKVYETRKNLDKKNEKGMIYFDE